MAVNREVEAKKYVARVFRTPEQGIYLVTNGRGNAYTVDLYSRICSCPDFLYRGSHCKHMIAAETRDLEAKEILWREGQRIGNGFITLNAGR